MGNTVDGLWETHIIPATAMLQQPTAFRNGMLRKIYIQPQPVPGRPGRYIEVNIPVVAEGDVVDIGSGPVQITDQDHTNVTLNVNNNKSKALRIPDFDAIRTPMDLYTFYLQPAIESVTRKINRSVCDLATSTNFNVHSSITGGADVFTRAHVANAWSNLTSVGVPMDQGLHFVTGNVPFSNMIATSDWISESVVGINAAESAQQRAMLMPAFGAQIDYDQQFPQPSPGATYAALMFHPAAIAMVPVTPPATGKAHVAENTFTLPGSGLTYRVQFWYDPREQAWILHVHACYALAVVRPNFGSYLVST